MVRKIMQIRVEYDNGEALTVYAAEIEKIYQLLDAINMLERARLLYEQLAPLFQKRGDKNE